MSLLNVSADLSGYGCGKGSALSSAISAFMVFMVAPPWCPLENFTDYSVSSGL